METANYPLSNYIHYNVSQEIQERYKLAANDAYIDRISHMVEDDDINTRSRHWLFLNNMVKTLHQRI